MSQPSLSTSEFKILSDTYPALCEALDVLYIPKNQSARINFTKAWPAAAIYIFGEELISYDRDGAKDRARRVTLEDAAEAKRLDLVAKISGVEDKSTHSGVLQVEYVKPLVLDLGRDLALHVYSPKIVDRFFPPPVEPKPAENKPIENKEEKPAVVSAPANVAPAPAAPVPPPVEKAPAPVYTPVSAPVQKAPDKPISFKDLAALDDQSEEQSADPAKSALNLTGIRDGAQTEDKG